MKKIYLLLILLFILVSIILFYWFQIRPAEIRKSCVEKALAKDVFDDEQNNYYRVCLVKNGLAPDSIFVNVSGEYRFFYD